MFVPKCEMVTRMLPYRELAVLFLNAYEIKYVNGEIFGIEIKFFIIINRKLKNRLLGVNLPSQGLAYAFERDLP